LGKQASIWFEAWDEKSGLSCMAFLEPAGLQVALKGKDVVRLS